MKMNKLVRSTRNSIVAILAILFLASSAFGAGTVTKAMTKFNNSMWVLEFTCIGDSSNGSIPDTVTSDLSNYQFYIYRVIIESKAADANVTNDSDVYIKDAYGTDLLSAGGVDQLDDSTINYIKLTNGGEPVVSTLTLSVSNQSSASGKYYVRVILIKKWEE